MNGGTESSTGSITYYTNGVVTGYANGTTTGGNSPPNASAQGTATIYFEVFGPANVSVPLIITASGSTSASGVRAETSINVGYGAGSLLACSGAGQLAGACGSEPTSFTGSKDFNLTSDGLTDYNVTVTGNSTDGPGSFSATVDPMIEINPTFPDASEFTLVFSSNDVTPVPEPSSWILMSSVLVGILGAGWIRLKGGDLRRS
jgi:hypothetical protein